MIRSKHVANLNRRRRTFPASAPMRSPLSIGFRRSIEANRNFPLAHFELATALAQLGRQDEARSAVKAGLALNPTFSISRARGFWTRESSDPKHLAQLERIFEGLRNPGLPER